MKHRIYLSLLSLLLSTCASATTQSHYWYIGANAGIFQGHFNLQYNDKTDTIPQNIHEPAYQNGYIGSLAIGYIDTYHQEYFFGSELSASAPTDQASFASGAATTAFTDKLSIKGNIDFTVLGGLMVTDSTSAYGKIGLSYASITSNLNTPTGFTATFVNTTSTRDVLGGTLALGLKKFITTNTALFTECTYHDYGNVNFPNFQNFTATYSHSAHVYTQNVVVGVAYTL